MPNKTPSQQGVFKRFFHAIAEFLREIVWSIRNNLRNFFGKLYDKLFDKGLWNYTRPVRRFALDLFARIQGPRPDFSPTNDRQSQLATRLGELRSTQYVKPTNEIGFFASIRKFIDRLLTLAPSDYFNGWIRAGLALLLLPVHLLGLVFKIICIWAYIPYENILKSIQVIFDKWVLSVVVALQLLFSFGGEKVKGALVYTVRSVAGAVVMIPFLLFITNYRKVFAFSRPYFYIAPALIMLSIFTFYPIFNTIFMSFLEGYSFLAGTANGIGLGNYIAVLNDPVFYQALKNTLLVAFISVPIAVVVALLIAVALNSIKFFQGFIQTVFFLPYVTNVIAIGLVFTVMFNSRVSPDGLPYGIINNIIGIFGIEPIKWVSLGATYATAVTTLIIYTVWSALAFKIMVFLSGIQGIDKQYYQAAKVDATPKWRVLLRVTVPLLSPMIAYVTITSFIGGFKSYAAVVALFGDRMGPAGQSNMMITVVGYIFNAWTNLGTPGELSKAAAGSVILLIIILIFTAVELQISKKRVHY